jgi:hypothetical protein
MSASEADDEAKKLEENRTNSMGFFNTAEAFRLSAMALEASKVKIGHADKPIRVLTYHALELYLKAMLRQNHNTETIKRRFGHDTKRPRCPGLPSRMRIATCSPALRTQTR